MKPLISTLLAVAVGGAALAGGLYVRTQLDAPAADIITVRKAQTDRGAATRRPDFVLEDSEARRRSISEWDGKFVVMNFWATWCPPCLHEIPMFIELQTRYRSRGVQFLGVAIDDGDKVRAFAEKVELNYPTLHGQLQAIEIMSAYGNTTGGLPFTVFIDASGTIVARHPGVLDEETTVELLEDLL